MGKVKAANHLTLRWGLSRGSLMCKKKAKSQCQRDPDEENGTTARFDGGGRL